MSFNLSEAREHLLFARNEFSRWGRSELADYLIAQGLEVFETESREELIDAAMECIQIK